MASLVYLILFVATHSAPFSTSFALSIRKELRDNDAKFETFKSNSLEINNRINLQRVVQLSWRPRVFLYKGFLTDEECDHLVSLGRGLVEMESGDSAKQIVENMQIANSDDPIIARIEKRISAWTFLPKENGKPLQVMHYGIEDAKQRFDYSGNGTLLLNEPLMATVVLYLSNATRGGEILFPKSEMKDKVWSDCTKSSSVLKPMKGNAVLFFNVHLNASPDTSSAHARCPVLKGEMWYATKHFSIRAINADKKPLPESNDSDCTDEDDNCPRWAALGECQRNPVFMTGSPDYYGTCRKSCNAC